MKALPLSLAHALALTAALAGTAHAHPGPHEMEDASNALAHVLGSPDHASWLILGLVAVASFLAIKAAVRIARLDPKDRS